MGAWGEHPEANDTAADFVYELEETPFYEWVKNGLSSKWYDEQRIVAHRLGEQKHPDKETCRKAIDKLKVILDDEEWIECWASKAEIRESLETTIETLELKQR